MRRIPTYQWPAPYTRIEHLVLEGIAETLWIQIGSRLKPDEFWHVLRHKAIERGLAPPSLGQAEYLIRKFKAWESLERRASQPCRDRPLLVDPVTGIWFYGPSGTGKNELYKEILKRADDLAGSSRPPQPENALTDSKVCSSPSACDKCLQQDTCRRIGCCVLYDRPFGDIDKP